MVHQNTTGGPSGRIASRHSILWRTTVFSVVLTTVIILVTAGMAFVLARSLIEQRAMVHVATLASAKEDFLERTLHDQRRSVQALAADPRWNTARPEEVSSLLGTLLAAVQESDATAEGMAVFAADGSSMATVGNAVTHVETGVRATRVTPVLGQGWEATVVSTPLGADRTLAVRYDAHVLRATLMAEDGAEVLLSAVEQGQLRLVQYGRTATVKGILPLGAVEEQLVYDEPAARAVSGLEGVVRTQDYLGRDSYVATRLLPALGWGLVVQVPRAEILAGVHQLGRVLLLVGAVLVVLSSLLSFMLARRLTGPLRSLATRIASINTKTWSFRSGTLTRDEVGVLEGALADLTRRLRRSYRHLEDEVADRTRELQEQYALDRAILESIGFGVLIVGSDGTVTHANPSAVSMLSTKETELLGRTVEDAFVICAHKQPLRTTDHPIVGCLRSRKAYRSGPDARLTVERSDGTLLPIALAVTPLRRERTLLGAVAIFQDVTEERQVDYLKSEFISLASHQLRTPLSAMLWYAELLLTDKPEHLTAEQHTYITEMQMASRRMVNLVDALLQASRLEGGAIQPKPQRIDLNTLIAQTVEDMRLFAKEHRVTCTMKEAESPAIVQTDPMLLTIVLQNIFSNAVKYSPSGSNVAVHVENHRSWVDVVVEDHGIGIPADEVHRLFEKLFRAHNVRTLDTDGSGLGLYISRLIMQNLGGTIRVKSREGAGTKVSLRVPLRKTARKKRTA